MNAFLKKEFIVTITIVVFLTLVFSLFNNSGKLISEIYDLETIVQLEVGTENISEAAVGVAMTSELPPRVVYFEPLYAADFSDDRILVGASHNVFVGTVVEQTGTKERGIGPESQFQVEVVTNIKGDLQGSVTVNQQGGYKNGILYVVADDEIDHKNGSLDYYLIKPGSTYLFATRYNEKENWHTLNSYPTAKVLINNNPQVTLSERSLLAENNVRVEQLKAAYSNEILIKADVQNNKALNSYDSRRATPTPVQEPDKEEIKDTTISETTAGTSTDQTVVDSSIDQTLPTE